jgi:hypothetical protein
MAMIGIDIPVMGTWLLPRRMRAWKRSIVAWVKPGQFGANLLLARNRLERQQLEQ